MTSLLQNERREHPRALFLPMIFLAGAILIQLKMAWQLGFFHEVPAEGGKMLSIAPLSTDHSLLLRYLGGWLSQGYIGARTWHGFTLVFHYVNIGLFFIWVRRSLKLDLAPSIIATAFAGMTPLGIEALVWGCCGNLLLTLTWTLLGLICLFSAGSSIPLFFLQLIALLTWNWGVLLFPVLLLFSFFAKRRSARFFLPTAICWGIGTLLILLYGGGLGLIDQNLTGALSRLITSPLFAFFPPVHSSFAQSVYGKGILIAIYFLFFWQSIKDSRTPALLAAYFLLMLPFAFHATFEARYTYPALPFLFLNLTLLSRQARYKELVSFFLLVFLGFQFFWMIDRIEIWDRANRQIDKLEKEIKEGDMAERESFSQEKDQPAQFGPSARAVPVTFRCYVQDSASPGAQFLPSCEASKN